MTALDALTDHLLQRAQQVRDELGGEGEVASEQPLADIFDSMGMVEYLLALAQDFGVALDKLESCLEHRVGNIAEMAAALHRQGIALAGSSRQDVAASSVSPPLSVEARAGDARPRAATTAWLGAGAARLGERVESSREIDTRLGKPAGWLQRHAGIHERRLWHSVDPLDAAADACRECLAKNIVSARNIGALLVVSEAPPILLGMGATLHHRLGLHESTPAWELGGACTGFLAALRLGRHLLASAGAILIAAIEAPSRFLHTEPGPAGENAALFGDAAAACVLTSSATNMAVPLVDVTLHTDGAAASLITAHLATVGVQVSMKGKSLATRAVRAMADATSQLAGRHGLTPAAATAILAHAGNGRFPRLLAARLGVPTNHVRTLTPHTGNLGAASLPALWAAQGIERSGSLLWTAAGAGLTWGAALTGRS